MRHATREYIRNLDRAHPEDRESRVVFQILLLVVSATLFLAGFFGGLETAEDGGGIVVDGLHLALVIVGAVGVLTFAVLQAIEEERTENPAA